MGRERSFTLGGGRWRREGGKENEREKSRAKAGHVSSHLSFLQEILLESASNSAKSDENHVEVDSAANFQAERLVFESLKCQM